MSSIPNQLGFFCPAARHSPLPQYGYEEEQEQEVNKNSYGMSDLVG
jgi:hypothetical protein